MHPNFSVIFASIVSSENEETVQRSLILYSSKNVMLSRALCITTDTTIVRSVYDVNVLQQIYEWILAVAIEKLCKANM